ASAKPGIVRPQPGIGQPACPALKMVAERSPKRCLQPPLKARPRLQPFIRSWRGQRVREEVDQPRVRVAKDGSAADQAPGLGELTPDVQVPGHHAETALAHIPVWTEEPASEQPRSRTEEKEGGSQPVRRTHD